MASKVGFCFLTVIYVAAASAASSQNQVETTTISQETNVGIAKERQGRFRKMEQTVGNLNESLTEQLNQVQDQMQHLEDRLEGSETSTENPKVHFTTLEDVGLAFSIITETLQQDDMEEHCAQLVDWGRMIVLDSKAKLEAVKTYVMEASEEPSFYVGLKKSGGQHLWSNGVQVDDSFWCTQKSGTRSNPCGIIKIKDEDRICISAVRCKDGEIICEKPM